VRLYWTYILCNVYDQVVVNGWWCGEAVVVLGCDVIVINVYESDVDLSD
jgi:hypothetical protein